MREAYVGFYWTLPVSRRGFRTLPAIGGVEAAAKKSRTIRYQREVVKRQIDFDRADLIAEFAFMEVADDRGTEAVREILDKIAIVCKNDKATMIFVRFADNFFWRPHNFMMTYLEEKKIPKFLLDAEPIYIDGREFNPTEHFRRWQRRHESDAAALRSSAQEALAVELARVGDVRGRYQAVADALNAQGVTTARGRPWTAEGIRKAHERQRL